MVMITQEQLYEKTAVAYIISYTETDFEKVTGSNPLCNYLYVVSAEIANGKYFL